ncbi:uncharacterized protein FIBRA_08684 [Fibroporia radiculosa]|uniref:Heme haloperoxidase family profile domain-containing protein n=1 Tax=Fibroporia radiculosa TaxID=599839 RepID=J4GI20_9APHY|nr:uncharacterized protein FIBRA_08684 [Fibroporia radiculosa]CCM06423.1 predicted protein [Fibroporia radiculosa]
MATLSSVHPKGLHIALVKYALVTAIVAAIMKLIFAIDGLVGQELAEFSLQTHPFVPPSRTDSRSPCPALNTLANHGFLPHDGRGISYSNYIRAMREGYNLSLPLATLLTYGGHMILSQYSALSLSDLSRHNFIEHNASLGHPDAVGDEEYAPTKASLSLIYQMTNESTDGSFMTMHDFASARVLREREYKWPALDPLHEEIARGEISMVLGVFGGANETVPVRWLQEWWLNERFPEDFKPRHSQTLFKTVRGSWKVKRLMREIKKAANVKRQLHELD